MKAKNRKKRTAEKLTRQLKRSDASMFSDPYNYRTDEENRFGYDRNGFPFDGPGANKPRSSVKDQDNE